MSPQPPALRKDHAARVAQSTRSVDAIDPKQAAAELLKFFHMETDSYRSWRVGDKSVGFDIGHWGTKQETIDCATAILIRGTLKGISDGSITTGNEELQKPLLDLCKLIVGAGVDYSMIDYSLRPFPQAVENAIAAGICTKEQSLVASAPTKIHGGNSPFGI